jgi:hypothetical protein
VNGRQTLGGAPVFGGFAGRPPRDLVVLLAVVFVTFSLQFFSTTAPLLALARLTPAVWRAGALWQLATYPFAGYGPPSLLFLLELLMLYWFGRDVFERLGRRRFWTRLAYGAVGGGIGAVAVDLAAAFAGSGGAALAAAPFVLLQGQRMLLVVAVAAFATLNRHATILLFFVLPMPARWFLGLEIVIAFLGFLGTRDLAGFLGICAAVGIVYGALYPSGPRRAAREGWLRLQQGWARRRLARLRRRRGIRVVGGEGRGPGRGPWLN